MGSLPPAEEGILRPGVGAGIHQPGVEGGNPHPGGDILVGGDSPLPAEGSQAVVGSRLLGEGSRRLGDIQDSSWFVCLDRWMG